MVQFLYYVVEMSTITYERLNEIFQCAGSKYGFEEVTAEFVPFRSFNIRWRRTDKCADFKVTDYLEDAPEEVLTELAEGLFGRMHDDTSGLLIEITNKISSHEFSECKQPIYLGRTTGITKNPQGRSKNLNDSISRLKEQHLITDEDTMGIFLTWLKGGNAGNVGNSSVLMRAVIISDALDSDTVPDIVLDYAVYCELCLIKIGFYSDKKILNEMFAGLENKFDRKDESKEWLKQMGLCV